MRYFKLIALSVSASGNRVLHKEDGKTYPENTWPNGRADELVKQGFIEEVKPIAKTETKPVVIAPIVPLVPITPKNPVEATKLPLFDDVDKKDIKAELDKLNVPYDNKMNKTTLYDLWVFSVK
jgi:hypothetical protein